jgi:hypothetical protein
VTLPAGVPEPLTPAEIAELERWRERMIRALAVSVVIFLLWLVLVYFAGDQLWVQSSAFVVAAPLVVTGLLMQVGRRCPRCEWRIGLQSRLTLPERCAVCGVSFRD